MFSYILKYYHTERMRQHRLNSMNRILAQITDIFVTHFHSDHYNAECISQIAKASDRTLRVWVRADARRTDVANVEWKFMQKGEQYTVDENMKVTGLLANHNESVYPQHILLETEKLL